MIAEQVEGQLGAHPTGPQKGDSHTSSLASGGQFLHGRLRPRGRGGAQWSPCLRGSADVEHSRPPPRQAWASPPQPLLLPLAPSARARGDRKSTRLNSSHVAISYAVFCLKKKTEIDHRSTHEQWSRRASITQEARGRAGATAL